MMKHFYIKLSVILLICSLPFASYASIAISPVKIRINKDEKITAITVKNDSDETKNFQLIMYKMERENGKEVLKETKDLTISPMIFKIDPGKTQLVRIAIKNQMYSTVEKGYTVSIKELPRRRNVEGAHVHMVTEFNLPVSVFDKAEDSDKGQDAKTEQSESSGVQTQKEEKTDEAPK